MTAKRKTAEQWATEIQFCCECKNLDEGREVRSQRYECCWGCVEDGIRQAVNEALDAAAQKVRNECGACFEGHADNDGNECQYCGEPESLTRQRAGFVVCFDCAEEGGRHDQAVAGKSRPVDFTGPLNIGDCDYGADRC